MMTLTMFWSLFTLLLWYKLELRDRIKYRGGHPYELIDLQEEMRMKDESRQRH